MFNYGFGRNFDAHAGIPPNLVGVAQNLQCFIGRKCYITRCVFSIESRLEVDALAQYLYSSWEYLPVACAQLVGNVEEFETGKRSCGFDLNLA